MLKWKRNWRLGRKGVRTGQVERRSVLRWEGSKADFLRQRQALLPRGLDFVHQATGLFLKFKGNSVVRFAFRETLYYFNMENGLERARLQTRRWGAHVTAWDLWGGGTGGRPGQGNKGTENNHLLFLHFFCISGVRALPHQPVLA